MAWYRCGMNGTYNATTVSRSGAVCNYVANVGGVPLSRFIANITPVQSGTGDPSPINPRAITGRSAVNVTRTGANLWDEEWQSGAYSIETGDYFIANNRIASANFIPIKANSTYSIVAPYTGTFDVLYYDANKSYIGYKTNRSGRVFTTPTNCYYINISVWSTYGTTYNNDISINYPATDTAYHAYTGQTATINLGGTSYLATLNVLTGLLTVLGKYLVFNSAEYYGTYGADNAPLFYVDITGEGIVRMQNASYGGFLISNMLSKITTSSTQTMKNYEIRTDNTPTKLYFRMDDYTSKAAIDTFLADNPLEVVAELSTPVTYQLTPAQITQLLGENNVWADSGDSEVDFFKIIRT